VAALGRPLEQNMGSFKITRECVRFSRTLIHCILCCDMSDSGAIRLRGVAIYRIYRLHVGARGSVVVKALCYKPEGRGFDSRGGKFLNLPNLSGRIRPWGLLSL
jgi:hypothetical protein